MIRHRVQVKKDVGSSTPAYGDAELEIDSASGVMAKFGREETRLHP